MYLEAIVLTYCTAYYSQRINSNKSVGIESIFFSRSFLVNMKNRIQFFITNGWQRIILVLNENIFEISQTHTDLFAASGIVNSGVFCE